MDYIERAVQVASQAHDGQYRKLTQIPYISHPIAVGIILMKAGYGDDLVAAGILHDTVEDTKVTLDDIQKVFGYKITEIVKGCSEPNKSLSWENRKEHTIKFLKTASTEIRIVACADKLHNIRSIRIDIENEGDKIWGRFNRGRNEQEWYYRSIVESIGHLSAFTLLKELRSEVDRVFN